MDTAERLKAISQAPKTGVDARLWILGEWKPVPIVRVPVSALVLNIDNRRFTAERQLYEAQIGHHLDPENSDVDALSVEAILLDVNLTVDGDQVVGKEGKDFRALRQDWQSRKQESPFWVRPDGTVHNGNRRLAMLRRLHRTQGISGYEYVDAVVLDPEIVNELVLFEMEQREQLTEDYKVRYTDINLLLAIQDAANDLEIDWYEPESIAEVASELQHVMRNDPNYALVQLYAIRYMNEYLDDLGLPGRYDKVIGQIERFRDVGRIMRTVEADDPDRSPAMIQVLFAAVNAKLTHLNIRKIRGIFTSDRDSFDQLVNEVNAAENGWVKPSDEDALADPDVVSGEAESDDEGESVIDPPEPPGPSVTNYPSASVAAVFKNAFDRHEAATNDDLLSSVREVINRLDALANEDESRLLDALGLPGGNDLRSATLQMLAWFDAYEATLR